MASLLNSIELLTAIGFEFHLDWDDELEITAPESVDPAEVIRVLEPLSEVIAWSLKAKTARARQCLNGGPFAGRRHEWTVYAVDANGRPCNYFRGFRVRRACWAVYEILPDGRGFFRGHATSECKARRGQIVTPSPCHPLAPS